MKKLLFLLFFLLTMGLYSGTIYEDGNDASDWEISDNRPSGATVNTVLDNGNSVIALNGNKRRNAYLLGDRRVSSKSWNNSSDKNITWSMKFNESFSISIFVETTKGKRVLQYNTSSSKRKRRTKLYYGLGSQLANGNWQTITRNIENDIQELESGNTLLTVYGFMVRGSGLVDDIKMGENNTPVAITSIVSGRIVDTNGVVMPGVVVKTFQNGNLVAFSDTTDVNGLFDLTLPADNDFTLQFESVGHSTQVKTVKSPHVNQHINFDIVMIARGVPQNFQANIGASMSGADGAKVTVGANAFVDGNGNPFSGQIIATITPVDVSTRVGVDAFPGNFSGVPTGASEPLPIASYGVVEYKFTTPNGEKLQLAQGETATIELPIFVTNHPDGTPIEVGDTIPLWYLNEDTGIWQQDGTGEVVASASSPTGFAMRATVTHFTWWNCDVSYDRAEAIVTVTGPDSGTAVVYGHTNANIGGRPSTVNTDTIVVGASTNKLYIPANNEVCFWADIIFDNMGTATTPSQCITVATNDVAHINLNISSDTGLNLIAINAPANTELGEAPAQIKIQPTTAETTVTYTLDNPTCLPLGVHLDGNPPTSAFISGTPLEVGNFNCTVTGIDADNNTNSIDIEYNVVASPVTTHWENNISSYGEFEDVVVDVNGFSYAVGHIDAYSVCGEDEETGYMESVATVVKFGQDGTILEQWTSECDASRKLYGVTLDGMGNLYAVGSKRDSSMYGEVEPLAVVNSNSYGGGYNNHLFQTLLVKLNSDDLTSIYEQNIPNEDNDLVLHGVAYYNNNTENDITDDTIYAVGQSGHFYESENPKESSAFDNKSLVVAYLPDGTLLYDTISNGNTVPNTVLFDLVLDYSGGIWAVGATSSNNNDDGGGEDALLVAINNINGAELPWSRELFNPNLYNRFYGVDIDLGTQKLYMVGRTFNNSTNTLVAGYDTLTGTPLWGGAKSFGGGSNDVFYDIKYSTLKDTLYAVGYTFSNDGDITNNSGNQDALLMNISPNGVKVWDKTIGTGGYEKFKGIALDYADNIYAVGKDANESPWIIKLFE